MRHRKQLILLLVLSCLVIIIRLYSGDPQRVETGYSTGVFPKIAISLRALFGWIPFSIGDIGYGAVVFFLVRSIIKSIAFRLRRNKLNWRSALPVWGLKFLNYSAAVYIIFNICWGINYNRVGIASQLGLGIKKYSVEELKMINRVLLEKVNSSKMSLLQHKTVYPGKQELFAMTSRAYEVVAKEYPFLTYGRGSLKPSLWSRFGNYTGFLGYYNPFTGEAQVNTTVPKFTQPFTACHETAHQLGYAKEMEANFVGYLASTASPDTLFHYSVYTDLFTYANRSLFFADSSAALQYRKMLLPEVLADFNERREFSLAHRSFLEPVFRVIYGLFLKSNQQPMGMLSYDEVTGFIIAYYKKFGKI